MTSIVKNLENEHATVAMGQLIAQGLTPPLTIFLTGDLGAGKTTLSRGIIQSLGHEGAVKSPTYTLVEPYELANVDVFHFDLYRVADPEELEFMGIRDYFNQNSICIVEWPEHGQDCLPSADLHIHLSYQDNQREMTISAESTLGQTILTKLK
ncbi:tRNA (adenosine(37)-N6)-threonylcarbamoyltransferase complex ATPase subunit type 1 TsaE [Shewanella gaetbuli]|uniref:tRNA threonylcarbamoyladenosine biosynthesis protein TsaE n=1 Tax=Shewanella gaetbuli TaxID=220752 RepID=A0A9X1ZIS1_9GAMM|nr:tRNA (adenosine(37)-N6)-threonylcarbamoyltransferase complex ATPase subunit type 1 TsaE [Shewanella gaetbuli]MCL1142241.1 tRNA (adenosine(37)-N6)-threonylcarbamoyltransferase complex ATPase subunit type 1 TsaE [Shewanella gaetbuli]